MHKAPVQEGDGRRCRRVGGGVWRLGRGGCLGTRAVTREEGWVFGG